MPGSLPVRTTKAARLQPPENNSENKRLERASCILRPAHRDSVRFSWRVDVPRRAMIAGERAQASSDITSRKGLPRPRREFAGNGCGIATDRRQR